MDGSGNKGTDDPHDKITPVPVGVAEESAIDASDIFFLFVL